MTIKDIRTPTTRSPQAGAWVSAGAVDSALLQLNLAIGRGRDQAARRAPFEVKHLTQATFPDGSKVAKIERASKKKPWY